MTESLGWVVALVVGVLAAFNRIVAMRRNNDVGEHTAPPDQIAVTHAKEAIKSAAAQNMGEIDDAMEGDDVASKLAELANRAAKRRKQ